MQIERVALPGVGISYTFTTASGQHLGVICHFNGRREFLIYERGDRETVQSKASLDTHEAHHLADLLHHTVTVDHVADLERGVAGISIARLPVPSTSPLIGHKLSEVRAKAPNEVSIVAIIQEDRVVSGPGADYLLAHEDTVVAVGPHEKISALGRTLTGRDS